MAAENREAFIPASKFAPITEMSDPVKILRALWLVVVAEGFVAHLPTKAEARAPATTCDLVNAMLAQPALARLAVQDDGKSRTEGIYIAQAAYIEPAAPAMGSREWDLDRLALIRLRMRLKRDLVARQRRH